MKVYRDYDQTELDRQYDQASLVPDMSPYQARRRAGNELAARTLECRRDVPYGPSVDEMLDVYPATRPGAPVAVYFHGGAWTRGERNGYGYLAPALVGAGAAYVAAGFSVAPKATLDEMVRQCRAVLVWTARNAAAFNADPERIHVIGHSSGSHLAAMTLTTDWPGAYGLAADLIKGACCVSGLYDLEPVRLSHRNRYLFLDARTAERNSPIRHLPASGPPLIVGWGTEELAEFQRQNREFAAAWGAAGLPCTAMPREGLNHFDMSEEYTKPESPIFQALRAQMGLGRGDAS